MSSIAGLRAAALLGCVVIAQGACGGDVVLPEGDTGTSSGAGEGGATGAAAASGTSTGAGTGGGGANAAICAAYCDNIRGVGCPLDDCSGFCISQYAAFPQCNDFLDELLSCYAEEELDPTCGVWPDKCVDWYIEYSWCVGTKNKVEECPVGSRWTYGQCNVYASCFGHAYEYDCNCHDHSDACRCDCYVDEALVGSCVGMSACSGWTLMETCCNSYFGYPH